MTKYRYPGWLNNLYGLMAIVIFLVAFAAAGNIKNPDTYWQTIAAGLLGLAAYFSLLFIFGREQELKGND